MVNFTGKVHKSTLVSLLNSGTNVSKDRLRRVRARQTRGEGIIDTSEDPALRLYADYIFKSKKTIFLGQVTRITNHQSSRCKTNYLKPILLQDIKELFPCLQIEVTLYTRDGDRCSKSSNVKVFNTIDLISILQLEYDCVLSDYEINQSSLEVITQIEFDMHEQEQNTDNNSVVTTSDAVPTTSTATTESGRVVLEVEPDPSSRSKRRRRVVVYEAQ